MTFEGGTRDSGGSFASGNSLDIRNDGLAQCYGEYDTNNEKSKVETRSDVVKNGQNGQIESGKNVNGVTNGSTPTELNDFLAMLDDKSTYSQVMDADVGGIEGGYVCSASELSGGSGVVDESGLFGRGSGGAAETGVEDAYIEPYLLNKQTFPGSVFMDDGLNIGVEDGVNDKSSLLMDELTMSPQPVVDRRRMSEVANATCIYPTHSRGSISHQLDFWNLTGNELPEAASSQPQDIQQDVQQNVQQQMQNSQPQQQLFHPKYNLFAASSDERSRINDSTTEAIDNATSFDLLSFKKQSKHKQQKKPTSFKIDNELTQLMSVYNMAQPSMDDQNKLRSGSFNQQITKRSNSSTIEPPNRVGKQRYSMSLLDGNQDLISKLYADMASGGFSWENAIMSDDEEKELDEMGRQSSLNSTEKSFSQNPTDSSNNSRFISPQLLNNDPLVDPHSTPHHKSMGINRPGLNFELNLPISSADSPTSISQINSNSPTSIIPPSAAGNQNSQQNNTRKKRSSISKPKTTASTSPLDGEEKPFKCDQCNKAFRRSEHLKRHVRSVHSTERPFHCQFCDKKFSRSDNLSQHLKTHKKHGDISELPPPRRISHTTQQ